VLARFRESRWVAGQSKEESVLAALLGSGHVVVLSGCTLWATFLLLFAFPQNFLNSVAWVCSAVVVTGMLTNLSFVPCLLLEFDSLSVFEPLPCWHRFHRKDSHAHDGAQSAGSLAPPGQDVTPAVPVSLAVGSAPGVREVEMVAPSAPGVAAGSAQSSEAVDAPAKIAIGVHALHEHAPVAPMGFCAARRKRSIWFAIPWVVTEHPFAVLVLTAAITAPFLWQFLQMHPTSDQTLIYLQVAAAPLAQSDVLANGHTRTRLQGSPSLDALNAMQSAFPRGELDPYQIIITTNANNSVLTQNYFDTEYALIQRLLATQASYMNAASVKGLSFWNSARVDFTTAMSFLTPGSPLYNSSTAAAYRAVVASSMNAAKSAFLVTVPTIVDPNAEGIVPWIKARANSCARDEGVTWACVWCRVCAPSWRIRPPTPSYRAFPSDATCSAALRPRSTCRTRCLIWCVHGESVPCC
jgi:hypothetical protein